MARRSVAKTLFDAHIDSSSAWLTWIEGSSAFNAALKPRIPWQDLVEQEKAAVARYLKLSVPEAQVLTNSLYMTMVAAFEEYLRATIREVALSISAKNLTYENLSVDIRKLHIKESARLLRRVDSPPEYLVLNEIDLCRGLGSCVPGSSTVELNVDALADVEGLVKLQNFFERMSTFGVSLSFDTLGARPAVKNALKMPTDKSRAVANALEDEMGLMSKYRNRIAHTGCNAADVTRSVAADHMGILKAISAEISAVV